jgi:hypothetical protein
VHFLVLLHKFKYPLNARMWNILKIITFRCLSVVNWKRIILFCIALSTVPNINYWLYPPELIQQASDKYKKVLAVQAKKAYRGNSRIVPLTLDLGTIRRWLVNLTSWLLYPRENNGHALNRRLRAPPEPVWTFGEEKNILPCRDSNPGPPILKPTPYTTFWGIRN